MADTATEELEARLRKAFEGLLEGYAVLQPRARAAGLRMLARDLDTHRLRTLAMLEAQLEARKVKGE